MSEYPKWVTRAPGIGAVLCRNSGEEAELLDDWEEAQLELARTAALVAKAEAEAAKKAAQVVLPVGKVK